MWIWSRRHFFESKILPSVADLPHVKIVETVLECVYVCASWSKNAGAIVSTGSVSVPFEILVREYVFEHWIIIFHKHWFTQGVISAPILPEYSILNFKIWRLLPTNHQSLRKNSKAFKNTKTSKIHLKTQNHSNIQKPANVSNIFFFNQLKSENKMHSSVKKIVYLSAYEVHVIKLTASQTL